uniref:Uncharacterized protein n=1 Tax=Knipowitschia caucasica TaxID=637954 RepID=A0AAV2LTB2_KNICA
MYDLGGGGGGGGVMWDKVLGWWGEYGVSGVGGGVLWGGGVGVFGGWGGVGFSGGGVRGFWCWFRGVCIVEGWVWGLGEWSVGYLGFGYYDGVGFFVVEGVWVVEEEFVGLGGVVWWVCWGFGGVFGLVGLWVVRVMDLWVVGVVCECVWDCGFGGVWNFGGLNWVDVVFGFIYGNYGLMYCGFWGFGGWGVGWRGGWLLVVGGGFWGYGGCVVGLGWVCEGWGGV